MVQVVCWRCGHEWDYQGKSSNPRCPKCNKMFGKVKFRDYMKGYETPVKPPEVVMKQPETGVNPPETGVKPSETGVTVGSAIKVEQVDITPPPELDRPGLVDRLKRAEPGKPMPKIEIPYKTVEMFIKLPFDWWAAFEQDARFKLTAGEANNIAPFAKRILEKHLPDWLAKYMDELALALIVGMVLSSRIIIAVDKRKKETKPQLPMSFPQTPPQSSSSASKAKTKTTPASGKGQFATFSEEPTAKLPDNVEVETAWDRGAKQGRGVKRARRKK